MDSNLSARSNTVLGQQPAEIHVVRTVPPVLVSDAQAAPMTYVASGGQQAPVTFVTSGGQQQAIPVAVMTADCNSAGSTKKAKKKKFRSSGEASFSMSKAGVWTKKKLGASPSDEDPAFLEMLANLKRSNSALQSLLDTARDIDYASKTYVDHNLKLVMRFGDLNFHSRETCATVEAFRSSQTTILREVEKTNRAFHDLILHPLATLLATDTADVAQAKRNYRSAHLDYMTWKKIYDGSSKKTHEKYEQIAADFKDAETKYITSKREFKYKYDAFEAKKDAVCNDNLRKLLLMQVAGMASSLKLIAAYLDSMPAAIAAAQRTLAPSAAPRALVSATSTPIHPDIARGQAEAEVRELSKLPTIAENGGPLVESSAQPIATTMMVPVVQQSQQLPPGVGEIRPLGEPTYDRPTGVNTSITQPILVQPAQSIAGSGPSGSEIRDNASPAPTIDSIVPQPMRISEAAAAIAAAAMQQLEHEEKTTPTIQPVMQRNADGMMIERIPTISVAPVPLGRLGSYNNPSTSSDCQPMQATVIQSTIASKQDMPLVRQEGFQQPLQPVGYVQMASKGEQEMLKAAQMEPEVVPQAVLEQELRPGTSFAQGVENRQILNPQEIKSFNSLPPTQSDIRDVQDKLGAAQAFLNQPLQHTIAEPKAYDAMPAAVTRTTAQKIADIPVLAEQQVEYEKAKLLAQPDKLEQLSSAGSASSTGMRSSPIQGDMTSSASIATPQPQSLQTEVMPQRDFGGSTAGSLASDTAGQYNYEQARSQPSEGQIRELSSSDIAGISGGGQSQSTWPESSLPQAPSANMSGGGPVPPADPSGLTFADASKQSSGEYRGPIGEFRHPSSKESRNLIESDNLKDAAREKELAASSDADASGEQQKKGILSYFF